MIDHFEVKVVKFEESLAFYSLALAPLQVELKWSDEAGAGFGQIDTDKVSFVIEQSEQNAACHIAFSAETTEAVDAFHAAGIQAGYRTMVLPGLERNMLQTIMRRFC